MFSATIANVFISRVTTQHDPEEPNLARHPTQLEEVQNDSKEFQTSCTKMLLPLFNYYPSNQGAAISDKNNRFNIFKSEQTAITTELTSWRYLGQLSQQNYVVFFEWTPTTRHSSVLYLALLEKQLNKINIEVYGHLWRAAV